MGWGGVACVRSRYLTVLAFKALRARCVLGAVPRACGDLERCAALRCGEVLRGRLRDSKLATLHAFAVETGEDLSGLASVRP